MTDGFCIFGHFNAKIVLFLPGALCSGATHELHYIRGSITHTLKYTFHLDAHYLLNNRSKDCITTLLILYHLGSSKLNVSGYSQHKEWYLVDKHDVSSKDDVMVSAHYFCWDIDSVGLYLWCGCPEDARFCLKEIQHLAQNFFLPQQCCFD